MVSPQIVAFRSAKRISRIFTGRTCPVPQVKPAVVKAVRPVLDLPREQLLLEAGRVLKVAPMASDDERQRQIAFVEAIRKLTAEQEEPDAFCCRQLQNCSSACREVSVARWGIWL